MLWLLQRLRFTHVSYHTRILMKVPDKIDIMLLAYMQTGATRYTLVFGDASMLATFVLR